jgi:hypothetical protein
MGVAMAGTVGSSRCPLCDAALWASPSEPFGCKRCPRCGADLYVLVFSKGPVFFLARPGQTLYDLLAALMEQRLGVSADEMETALRSADSLDLVELVMEVEEAVRSPRD